MTWRVGNHWGVTIIREGAGAPAADGRRPDDVLAAVTFDAPALAARIVRLLNEDDARDGHGASEHYVEWARQRQQIVRGVIREEIEAHDEREGR